MSPLAGTPGRGQRLPAGPSLSGPDHRAEQGWGFPTRRGAVHRRVYNVLPDQVPAARPEDPSWSRLITAEVRASALLAPVCLYRSRDKWSTAGTKLANWTRLTTADAGRRWSDSGAPLPPNPCRARAARRPAFQPRRRRTAPVVRFPRRSTRYSPCSRSASTGTASCSVTFSLLR